MSKYNILFKTGDAELRALEKSKFNTSEIFPIIELTRGRKSKNDKIGQIQRRIDKLSKIFSDSTICLDLTTSEDLSNSEIEELYMPDKGYSNWVNYLKYLKDDFDFNDIVPTILVDTEDTELDKNLKSQVEQLSNNFKHLLYRNNLADDGYFEDIEVISEVINSKSDVDLTFVLDCEYVPVGATILTVDLIKARIKKVKHKIPRCKFIIVSTSFPRYVSEIGNDEYDIFRLLEIEVFNDVHSDYNDVQYGDYASINPVRNDTVVMARGWIPRIDVPTLNGIYYFRLRRSLYGNDYAATYSAVARKVFYDSQFPKDYEKNWGVKQITICKDGDAPGASPSFWISVRMSIYIEMQLRRLE